MKYYLRSQRRKEEEEVDTMIRGAGQVKILPTDIIDEILDYCSCKDILCLSTVNKFWNNYIKTSNRCMNRIKLKINEENYKDVETFVRDYQNISMEFRRPLRKEVASRILKKFSAIKSIRINESTVFDYLPQLRGEMKIWCGGFGNLPVDVDENDFFYVDEKKNPEWTTENVKQIFNTYASQLEIVHTNLGHELQTYAVNTLINLRAICVVGCCHDAEKDKDYKVNPSVVAVQMGYTVHCLHAFPNLRYLEMKRLSFEMIKYIFKEMHKMEIAVYYTLVYRGIEYDDNIIGYKRNTLRYDNYDFDKENKRNVKFFGTFTPGVTQDMIKKFWEFYTKV